VKLIKALFLSFTFLVVAFVITLSKRSRFLALPDNYGCQCSHTRGKGTHVSAS
jgi:hypothetical protein